MSNPFNPSFGNRPMHFYGRQEITRSIIGAVGDMFNPWRTTLITGVRGSGKTALLSDIRINLDNPDVVALYVVPNEALLDSILTQLYRQLPKNILNSMPELKNISINLGVSIGVETGKTKPNFTESFSFQVMEFIDLYMKHDKHIVFLIDEAQKHTEDMRVFIGVYQDLIMRNYSVSMVLAGLPTVISDILNDDVLTFLRRAKQVELENVELTVVEYEFKKVFLNLGCALTEDDVSKVAIYTFGYPYLIQLIGYYLWEDIQLNTKAVNLDDVLFKSKTELFRNVHKLVYADLSNSDRVFVYAMAEDVGLSPVSSIGERMQKNGNYISTYRDRLISSGIIKSGGHGLVGFTYPYMKEFLHNMKREQSLQ